MMNFSLKRKTNFAASVSPLIQRLRRISSRERVEEAKAFLDLFCSEVPGGDQTRISRWREIRRELSQFGTYEHTADELAFGARVAWRNHARCVGRLYWESLEVIDCREIIEPDAIAERMTQHMVGALNGGRVRSLISVFAPMKPNANVAHIESPQISQYAGYVNPDGSILGDRQNVEATRIAMALGHRPPSNRSAHDLLPYLIRDRLDRRTLHHVSDHAVRQIEINHPTIDAISELGMKWYAIPCVSNMFLSIGGIDYPCAPFNGFYMGTEIASRNLADRMRYDMLPKVAVAIGHDPSSREVSLWQDRALTELNVAVLHSFSQAGVTMVDHHTESSHFEKFCRREQVAGRHVSADWAWIVPPQASSYCESYHLPMNDYSPLPNFYRNRSDDGHRLMPFYGDRHRGKWTKRLDRLRRRWKLWSRSPQ